MSNYGLIVIGAGFILTIGIVIGYFIGKPAHPEEYRDALKAMAKMQPRDAKGHFTKRTNKELL